MALTQVRVKLGDTWTVLQYNAATGRYEAQVTAPGTSIRQPGGYYSLTAEATNQSGDKDTITGAQLPSLRMVVRETQAPTLTLVSPPAGWLTTNSPTFVFRAQDEAGGSGIDPDSAQATVDGVDLPCTVTAAGEGYTVTFARTGLSEGPHTVTVSISDLDGNTTTASAAYQVDTVPPELYILQPYQRHVVDDESVTVVVEARDGNGVEVTVSNLDTIAAAETGDGRWTFAVPLQVGENHIQVTAADSAGNTSTEEIYMIRLVTDRTQADVDQLATLIRHPVWEWTSQELAWFNTAIVRGAYNDTDLNRVGAAVLWLTQALAARGYDTLGTSPKTDWTEYDKPQWPQLESYLADVAAIRDAQGLEALDALPLPDTMRSLSVQGANDIERALVETDSAFPHYFAWTAGELTAGMD